MATAPQVETLESLLDYLDGLTGRPTPEELLPHIQALDLTREDVAEYVRFSEDGYQRNLIRAGEHYHALILCWASGQRSPIHNHPGSICGMRVIEGILTETVFEPTPCGKLRVSKCQDLPTGGVCVSLDANTHEVANLQEPGRDLITLHVYSPPLVVMDTFSFSGERIGEIRTSPAGVTTISGQ